MCPESCKENCYTFGRRAFCGEIYCSFSNLITLFNVSLFFRRRVRIEYKLVQLPRKRVWERERESRESFSISLISLHSYHSHLVNRYRCTNSILLLALIYAKQHFAIRKNFSTYEWFSLSSFHCFYCY